LWDGNGGCRDSLGHPHDCCGAFDKESNEEQARQIGEAWKNLGDQEAAINLGNPFTNGTSFTKSSGRMRQI